MAAPAMLTGQERPAGWELRFDQPGTPDSAVAFVTMEPGWHITTGPRVIAYEPSMNASGTYQVQTTIHLFPGAPREAFGLFIGGADLQGPDQSYTYFLIRGDGHFLIKQRQGVSTPALHPWTKHDAIVPMGTEDPATNVLAVDVGADAIAFFINGVEVARIPGEGIQTSGIVGLRVNHQLDIHIAELFVTPTGSRE
jgi:hypothetical protein